MKLLYNPSLDPAYNLALEEYFLTSSEQELIILWRNAPAVILGTNQNAIEEINADFVKEHNIAVIRRQSGGGAVFHDLGNINFTVIHAMAENDFNDYQKFTQPIIEFLGTLGVTAELHGRNDLLIDGKKFSGNAQAVRGSRIMHHGTLLYSADFSWLTGALNPSPAKTQSKGIKSTRSRVTNIREHLRELQEEPMEVEDFLKALYNHYLAQGMEGYHLTGQDQKAVETLVADKYSQWDWNFGKSPAYTYRNSRHFPFGTVEVQLTAEQGIISAMTLYGDYFGIKDSRELAQRLVGTKHTAEEIKKKLAETDIAEYIAGMSPADFISLF